MATKPPNSGPTHGRFRNTQKNLFSKFPKADAFPLGPSATTEFGIGRANLVYQNKIARASLSAQAAQIRAQYMQSRRGAIEGGHAGLSDVAGDMAERGIVGSTVHQAGRQDVLAATQGDISNARFARDTGLLGVNLSRLEAQGQLHMGLNELWMKKRAQQREMALGAFGSGGANPWSY